MFEIIYLHINMRLIRLLPSNNPDLCDRIQPSQKNIYMSLSLVLPTLSLSLAPLFMNVTSRGEDQCALWTFCLFTLMSPLILAPLFLQRPCGGVGALCLTQINCTTLVSCLCGRAGLCTHV